MGRPKIFKLSWYQRNKTKALRHQKQYYEENKARVLARQNEYQKGRVVRLRAEAFSHYGSVCFCCGETNPLFLTLDHANNDGSKHRVAMGKGKDFAGWMFYAWLKRNNWPAVGLRVACFNCNCGRQRNGGVCPHKGVSLTQDTSHSLAK